MQEVSSAGRRGGCGAAQVPPLARRRSALPAVHAAPPSASPTCSCSALVACFLAAARSLSTLRPSAAAGDWTRAATAGRPMVRSTPSAAPPASSIVCVPTSPGMASSTTSAQRASSTIARGSSRAPGGGSSVKRTRRRSGTDSVVGSSGGAAAVPASTSMPPGLPPLGAAPASSLNAASRPAHRRGTSTSSDSGSSATTRGGPTLRRCSSAVARFLSRCCLAAFTRSALDCAPLRDALTPRRSVTSAGRAGRGGVRWWSTQAGGSVFCRSTMACGAVRLNLRNHC